MTDRNDTRRILFALELGGNLGHLMRCLPLARKLREQGHTILFAVPDSRTAAQILSPHRFAFVEAPRATTKRQLPQAAVNYSDMLLHEGYFDPTALQGAVHCWLTLLQLFRPDVLVADHAPTAILAARVAKLPAVAVGSGFEIPPQRTPLPSIRPWQKIDEAQLLAADASLLISLNTVLDSHRQLRMNSVAELFGGVTRILATFPELDHYGERANEHYVGVFYGVEDEEEIPSIEWPDGEGARILVYMRPEMPGFISLLDALSDFPCRCIFVAPGTDPERLGKYAASHLRITHRSIPLAPLLAQADLAVGYGSIGFSAQALQFGKPQLLSPKYAEQLIMANRLADLGVGKLVGSTEKDWKAALEIMRSDFSFKSAANIFSEKYNLYNPRAVIHEISCLI